MLTIGFDLDDTLYSKKQPLKTTFSEFPITKKLNFDQFFTSFQKNSNIAFDKFSRNIWTLEESHLFRIKSALSDLDININNQDALLFQHIHAYNQENIQLLPFISGILDDLIKYQVQILIITNGPSLHQRKKIKNLMLEDYFAHEQVIVSEEENIAKPNSEIFRIAEKRLHIVKANAWFIGDSYHHDVIGSANADWKSIWLNEGSQAKRSNSATKTVESPKELKDFIDCLLKKY